MIGLLTMFFEFFKTGLFAVGGGLATIPFLSQMTEKYPWFTKEMLTDMIAVAESTPGPIGVNMATYAGYSAYGILGGIISTIGLVSPSVIVIILVATFLSKFNENKYVNGAFLGIRPAVIGLISAAAAELFKLCMINDKFDSLYNIFDIKSLILFLIFTFSVLKFKKLNPIILIVIGVFSGIILKLA